MNGAADSSANAEKMAIARVIHDAIGWALTKDFDVLFSLVAQDEGFFVFHPDSASTIVGFDAFKTFAERSWKTPAFRATRFEIRELRTHVSASGTVAWYSCFLDDFGERDGRESGWVNARWTGVVEKRGGRWVHTQMHFSFPTDRKPVQPAGRATIAHFRRMLCSMTWADRQSLAALRAAPAAHAQGLPLVAHLLAAEHIWLARLERREARLAVWPALALDECENLTAENEAGYTAFVGRLSEDQLAGVVRYRNSRGQEFVTPVIDILTHVVVHGAYHRGQIAKAIGRSGAPAPSTDFIMFARNIEPVDA